MIFINQQIYFIPKKKCIKDNFALGFSLVEMLIISAIGLTVFVLTDHIDRSIAYKSTLTVIMVLGTALMEIPTTQLRTISILKKCFLYLISKHIYCLDSRNYHA